jgi:hypothetical protein
MQRVIFGLLAAGLMSVAAPQLARADQIEPAVAKLAAPLAQAKRVSIDGRDWRCEADVCKGGTQGTDQPARRECGKLAKQVGEIAAYQDGRREISAADLASCNAAAK